MEKIHKYLTIDFALQHYTSLLTQVKETVIITLGENGSLLCTENMVKHIPAVKVQAIETTGAGDSYIGALIASLIHQNDMETACTFASQASAITVQGIGAQESMPTHNELRFLL